jgi:tetratricopeptide (TPR) repeat protein
MTLTRLIWVLLAVIVAIFGLVAAWSARRWADTVPWPADAGREWPGAETLRAAHAEARRWPVRREAVERLARLYLANGFNAEAAALLPGISARRPDAPEWVHCQAVLAADGGRLDEAVGLWLGLVDRGVAPAPVRVKLADALVKLNREAEAAAEYRAVLRNEPDQPQAWHGLVRLEVRQRRWAEAQALLREALPRAPEFYGLHALAATVARESGDSAGAAAADRAVKRLGRFRDIPDPWVEADPADCFDPYRLRVDADRLRADADLRGAFARIGRAIALEPGGALNFQLLATLHGVAGDEAAAERAYRRGLELDPGSATLALRYANLLERQGRTAESRVLLERATENNPAEAELFARLAAARERTGEWAQAVDAYRRLQALRPDRPETALAAARAAFRSGDEAGARAWLQENLRRFPDHEETLGYLVLDAVARGDAATARELLARVERVAPAATATRRLRDAVAARFGPVP